MGLDSRLAAPSQSVPTAVASQTDPDSGATGMGAEAAILEARATDLDRLAVGTRMSLSSQETRA